MSWLRSERDAGIFCSAVFQGSDEAVRSSGLSKSSISQIRDRGLRALSCHFRGINIESHSMFINKISMNCFMGVNYGWKFSGLHGNSKRDIWYDSYVCHYYIEQNRKMFSHPEWWCGDLESWPQSVKVLNCSTSRTATYFRVHFRIHPQILETLRFLASKAAGVAGVAAEQAGGCGGLTPLERQWMEMQISTGPPSG